MLLPRASLAVRPAHAPPYDMRAGPSGARVVTVDFTPDALRRLTPCDKALAARATFKGRSSVELAWRILGELHALLVSGELDPNTAPRWGDEAVRTLPNGRHVVLPFIAHSFSSVERCGAQFVADFLERASATQLDLSCVPEIRLPPFARE